MNDMPQSGQTTRMVHDAIDAATAQHNRYVTIICQSHSGFDYVMRLLCTELQNRGYAANVTQRERIVEIYALNSQIRLISAIKSRLMLESRPCRVFVDHVCELTEEDMGFAQWWNNQSYSIIASEG